TGLALPGVLPGGSHGDLPGLGQRAFDNFLRRLLPAHVIDGAAERAFQRLKRRGGILVFVHDYFPFTAAVRRLLSLVRALCRAALTAPVVMSRMFAIFS